MTKKNRSNFCEKPSSPFKTKNVTLIKKLKKRVRKSIFPFRKKLLKSQDLAKRKIIRDTSFFTKCGYECILLKNIVENGLETQNFEKILFLQFFPASISFYKNSEVFKG